MQTVIEKGVTAENVAALEKLIGLQERMELRAAEKAFNTAFVGLQTDIPTVQATEAVPDRQGNVKYYFAPYGAIMEQVRPMLQKHGFTVSFSMDFRDSRIIQSCTLSHVGGHSRTNQFMARIGNGPPGASEAQADGAASTYAKRFALCNALNIVCEVDTDAGQDAKKEGPPITWEQAAYLKEQVKETNSDEAAFLRFAGAPTYEAIGSARYDSLVAELAKKGKGRR